MKKLNIIFVLILITTSCSESVTQVDNSNSPEQANQLVDNEIKLRPAPNPDKNAYFVDLHVHRNQFRKLGKTQM